MGPSMKQVKRILYFVLSNIFQLVYFKRKIVSLHCTIGFYLTFGWEHFVRKAKKISNYKTDLYILPWSMVGRKSIIVVQKQHLNKLLDKAKILIIRSTNAKSLATMERVKICFINQYVMTSMLILQTFIASRHGTLKLQSCLLIASTLCGTDLPLNTALTGGVVMRILSPPHHLPLHSWRSSSLSRLGLIYSMASSPLSCLGFVLCWTVSTSRAPISGFSKYRFTD